MNFLFEVPSNKALSKKIPEKSPEISPEIKFKIKTDTYQDQSHFEISSQKNSSSIIMFD